MDGLLHQLTNCPGVYLCGLKERDGYKASRQRRRVDCETCVSKRNARQQQAKRRTAALGHAWLT